MDSLRQNPQTTLTPGSILANRYVITNELSEGGMGKIFLANQRPFNRTMVIKVMHIDLARETHLVERFYREARAVAQLNHPNTVTVFDFGRTEEGMLFMAMEYVPGISLGRLLRDSGPLPLEDAVAYTIQIAQSLGEAHAKGIVHRDLKPDNIMIVRGSGADSFVKVLDFGIAKLSEEEQTVTQAGSIVGTPLYMAPEQARSQPVDGRTDLYALGCCLFEMLTGNPPFDGSSTVAILLAHQNSTIPDLPDGFPPQLNLFLKRALAKNPQDRPSTASDFVAALLACFQNSFRSSGPHGRVATPIDSASLRRGSLTPASSPGGFPSLGTADTLDRDSRSGPPPEGAQRPVSTQLSPVPFAAGLRIDSKASSDIGSATIPSDPLQNAPPSFFDGSSSSSPDLSSSQSNPIVSPPPGPSPLPQLSPLTPSPETSPITGPPSEQISQETPPSASPSSSSRWPLIAAGLFLLLLLSTGVLFFGAAQQEQEPLAPTTALLRMDSDPPRATVEINGVPIGQTPLEELVSIGPLSNVRFVHPERSPVEFENIEIRPEGNRLFASLPERTLTLRITSEIDATEVLVNDRALGRLSGSQEEVFILDWPEEELLIRAVHPERGEAFRRISRSGLTAEITLQFADAAFLAPAPSEQP